MQGLLPQNIGSLPSHSCALTEQAVEVAVGQRIAATVEQIVHRSAVQYAAAPVTHPAHRHVIGQATRLGQVVGDHEQGVTAFQAVDQAFDRGAGASSGRS